MASSPQTAWRGLLMIVFAAGIPTAVRQWGGFSGRSTPAREVCSPGDPLVSLLQQVSDQAPPVTTDSDGEKASSEEPREDASRARRVRGVVRFRGESPRAAVANLSGKHPPLLQIDPETAGLAHAIVFLSEGTKLPQPQRPPGESGSASTGKPSPGGAKKVADKGVEVQAVMDQKDHEFTPRVVAIRAGAGVRFTNSDVANHNVHGHGLDSKNQFNVFTGGGGSHVQRFRAEKGQRPIRIGCDIHPWMQGWVYVFEHPWFAVTDREGRFELPELPPGHHRLAIRQPDARLEAALEVDVTAEEPTELTIDLGPANLPEDSGE
jgi:plastocyanin